MLGVFTELKSISNLTLMEKWKRYEKNLKNYYICKYKIAITSSSFLKKRTYQQLNATKINAIATKFV